MMYSLRRAAVGAALATGMLLSSPACIFTENGTTFSGSNTGRTVTLMGNTLTAGETITIEALADANADPYDAAATWVTVGTATAGTNAGNWNGTPYYTWRADFQPIPAGTPAGSTVHKRWREGGLLRLRAKGGPIQLQAIDDTQCVQGHQGDAFLALTSHCQSHDVNVLTLVDTDQAGGAVPSQTGTFISRFASASDGLGYYADVDTYFTGLGLQAPSTLAKFKTLVGLNAGDPQTSAVYYNKGDLGLGRDMHCRSYAASSPLAPGAACWVSNHGDVNDKLGDSESKAPPGQSALDAFHAGGAPFATVTMTYDPADADHPVKFFVYDGSGARISSAALDTQGAKAVPGVCTSCHGGEPYDGQNINSPRAHFLPFDTEAFEFHTSSPLNPATFKALNTIVYNTELANPGSNIAGLLEGWYGGPGLPGNFNTDYVPGAGASGQWNHDKTSKAVYREVYRPYCQTCHVAMNLTFPTFSSFNQTYVGSAACGNKAGTSKPRMPHAEITFENFWRSGARAHLVGGLNLANDCDGN